MKILERIKDGLKKFLRSNRRELKKEIQRTWDRLQTLKPGTKSYKECKEDYDDLLDREKELKKINSDFLSKPLGIVLGAILSIVGIVIYRRAIETTTDPFFRDIGKWFLKFGS